MRPASGIAQRVGHWSAGRPWRALGLWFVFVVVALALGSTGTVKLTDPERANGDSAAAERVLHQAGFDRPAQEQVLVQVPPGRSVTADAEARAAIRDILASIQATGRVRDVRDPLDPANPGQISRDRRSALVLFAIRGKAETADKRVGPVVDAVHRAASRHPGVTVDQFGFASGQRALNKTVGRDFHRAEVLSIPITLVILIFAFGALVAALVPLALALTAIVAATGLLAVASHAVHVDTSANSILLLIGLAVGVDYSLFYVRRRQEERSHGHDPDTALDTAIATSGHSVLVSGLTVIVAMAAMFLTGQGTFEGIAIATVLVVAVAMVGSLTVLPATIALLGDRLDRGRIPWLGRWLQRRRVGGGHTVWERVMDPVLQRPLLSAGTAAVLLIVLAVPGIRLHTALFGLSEELPRSNPVVQTYDRIQAAFPGGPQPADVVIKAPNVAAPPVRQAVMELATRAIASGRMSQPITVDVNPSRTVAVVDIPLHGNGQDAESRAGVNLLRHTLIPQTVGRVAEAHVTGDTAASMDFNAQLKARAPVVVAFVLALAFLLLLWNFRSLVIPATAIVVNLLSVGAAYGILVAAFQWGWGHTLFGLPKTPGITAWLPLFLFVVLFGLSMDYHVFLVSRIREAYEGGLSTRDAVHEGIVRSAGVITSAAVVMVAVFATFATLSQTSLKQLGIGLAVAVLLDATVVRGLLVPPVMVVLGRSNWWLPSRLSWVGSPAPTAPSPAPGTAGTTRSAAFTEE